MEHVPGYFHRLQHVRHVYACSVCEAAGNGGQVAAAEKSEAAVKGSPVEKGMLGGWLQPSGPDGLRGR